MNPDSLPTGPSTTSAPREDVARDDVESPINHDSAIERLAVVMRAKETANANLKRLSTMEAELRAELEAWFVETGQVTVKRHGLKLTLARRSDFRVTDVDQACAHLSDLGRLDEVMVTRADATIIATIGRELEGSETPLEGCERIQSARFTVTPIEPKGDGNAN